MCHRPQSLSRTRSSFRISLPVVAQARWALWYDNSKLKAATETWEENLKHIMAFDTVEDFWALFNNVKPPSMLTVRSHLGEIGGNARGVREEVPNARMGGF